MTILKGSSSHTVNVVVSSEKYTTIMLSELDRYKGLDPDGVAFRVNPSLCVHRDDKDNSISLGSLALLNITNGDVVKILKQVEVVVSNTKEGMAYKIDRLFSDDRSSRRGMPPGTLRIFSNGLASFYDGKSWRRVNLRKVRKG